ncbi:MULTISPECIES: glycosyltransferase family 4 protein [unclassified Petrotoga]|jgi:glycosyltransferase involved in cell wall biosynthesis|uniref:glycosyltransferase family 4 protein n=1 Tax=unclassified Petrotoga TaxID=2620614 RepID=UPI001E3FAC87|nr:MULTISPECIES: glycosyltransferase family 4 protein [unclassified Petrotoga]
MQLNIGMFSDTYLPQKNGVATAIKLYKDEMEKRGHNVYLFVPKYKFDYKRNDDKIFEFPAVKFLFEKEQRIALPFSPEIFKIKELNLDIIHSHDPFSMGILARVVSRMLKLKYVATHHTMYDYYLHYLPLIVRPQPEFVQRLIKNWCLKTDKIIAPTENIKETLVEYGVPSEHIVTIPTGIDLASFDKPINWDLKKEYPQIKEDDRILLFVGRLGKEKNISFLLKVFKKVLLDEPKVKFVIVGGGPEKEELEKLAMDLNITENVIFTGPQPREKVIDAYKQAYLFIFASYTETQGLVILESMAAGTPVVALGKLGVYDILSQEGAGGIMIKDLNEDDFSHEILKLLRDLSSYEGIKKKAEIFVKDNYSIEKCVDMILELYKREIVSV